MIATDGQRLFRQHLKHAVHAQPIRRRVLIAASETPWLSRTRPVRRTGLVRMNAIEATITNAIDINTLGGGHLRLMPGQYRVTPDRQGDAELVRIDLKQPTSPIRLTPVQWGILEAARFIERSEGRGLEEKVLSSGAGSAGAQ